MILNFSEDATKRKREPTPRDHWTEADLNEANVLFADFLKKKKCPGVKDCELAMAISKKRGGTIWKKKRDNIKKKISYLNNKKKRKRTKKST